MCFSKQKHAFFTNECCMASIDLLVCKARLKTNGNWSDIFDIPTHFFLLYYDHFYLRPVQETEYINQRKKEQKVKLVLPTVLLINSLHNFFKINKHSEMSDLQSNFKNKKDIDYQKHWFLDKIYILHLPVLIDLNCMQSGPCKWAGIMLRERSRDRQTNKVFLFKCIKVIKL